MQVLDDRTLFMDHSRGIAGEITAVVADPRELMLAYDLNQYRMSVEAMGLQREPHVVKL